MLAKILNLAVPALAAALIGFGALPATAADFSKGSNAQELGLIGEVKATFSGKVVDILCELSGDCPANCGDGKRQLGIVRDADNALVLVSKNAQFEFNGAVEDLLPYCGKAVDVDGLLLGDDPGMPAKVYMAQFIRLKGEADWTKTTRWTKAWAERNPEAKGEGPWYRRDPRVKKQIDKSGYFGLGHEVDEKWRTENQ
jgi:hypothetical protein